MAMLKEAGISETRIYVLNPAYVQKEAEQGPLGRVSWLSSFSNFSYFSSNDRGVDSGNRLRGVRRESVGEMPIGRAPPKIMPPGINQILEYSLPFVPEEAKEKYTAGLRELFHR